MQATAKGINSSLKGILVPLLLFGAASPASMALAQSRGTFTSTGDMSTPRQGHTATLLTNGKVLIAGGIGPYASPFAPLATVNSPVEVMVNGKSADILGAVGYPGAVDGYQVNFRVPPDTTKGAATVQVSAAWISGTPVRIMVQ